MHTLTIRRTIQFLSLVASIGVGISFAADSARRSLAVGASPESVVRGYDGKLVVSLMGTSREPGDGDGSIIIVDGDKITTLASGFDDPKGLGFVGGLIVVTDFDKVWTIDAEGTKTLLAGPEDFPGGALFLNDVVVAPDGEGVLITEMGTLGEMFSGPGEMWPLDSERAKNIPHFGRVYRVGLDGSISTVIDHTPRMPNPNGVNVLADGTVQVAEFFLGELLEWKAGEWRLIGDDYRSGDGVVQDSKGRITITEVFTGNVWLVDSKTGNRKLLAKLESAADHMYDEKAGEVIVPDTRAGKIVFIPVGD